MTPGPPSSRALLAVLLERNRLDEPDGRPLYRYGARERELAELRCALFEELGQPSIRPRSAMGFCLWTAEWWRRYYKGGPWKWEPLLAELGHPELAPGNAGYLRLQDMVADGVGAWKRQVLRLGSSRRYLATLACEGGLPLSLLARDSHLRAYMRAVTDEYRLFRSSGTQLQDLAERARHLLPRSWRQPVVYELAGQLVCQIWRLQQEVGDSTTPVIDLDRSRPSWRGELPVRLTDEIARTLLNGLLLDAAEAARGGRIRVRWDVEVIPVDNEQWEARGVFRMPVTVDSADFNKLFDPPADASVPERFDLCVQVLGGTLQPLAIVTPRRTGESGTWGVELLPFARKHQASGLEQPRELVARSLDACFSTSDFPGAGGLTELPWVFAPKDAGPDAGQPCHLVGQGSVKIREPWGLVAVPSDASPDVPEGSTAEVVGILRHATRRMYRVTGRVAFVADDGFRVVVETGASSATGGVEYRLHGKQCPVGRSGSPAYLGEPVMYQWHDGHRQRIPDESLQWRSDIAGSRWVPYAATEGVRGSGTLRCMTAGEVRHTTRLCVLPEEAQIEIVPSSDPQKSQILLRRFGDVLVGLEEVAGVQASHCVDGTDHCLTLTARDDIPRGVAVIVDWRGRGRAELWLPFPVKRAAFVDDAKEEELPNAVIVPVGRLTGIRAEVVIPGTAEFLVQGQYSGSDASELKRTHGLHNQPMDEVSHGHHTLDLARVQPAVDARLTNSDDLDGKVTLNIFSNQRAGSLPPTQVKVGRFDLELQTLDGSSRGVVLVGASEALISDQEVDELEIEALPLLDPAMEPTALVRGADTHVWHFPEDCINPGPYLVTGRQGAWQRVRPVTLYAGDQNSVSALSEITSVEEAHVQCGYDGVELEAFQSVARRMGSEPGKADRDWELAFAYLHETSLPVQVFPLLRAIAATPQASAMAAVIATSGQFDVLWDRMKAFSFAWWQVPLRYWRTALSTYVESVRSALETLDDRDQAESLLAGEIDSRLGRLKGQLSGLGVALDFLGARLLGTQIPPKSARIADPQLLESVLQKDLSEHRRECRVHQKSPSAILRLPGLRTYIQAFQHSNPWSASLFVSRVGLFSAHEWADYADAPAATAASVLVGPEMPDDLARTIRDVREEQTQWFDEALRLALLIAFGRECADKIRRGLK